MSDYGSKANAGTEGKDRRSLGRVLLGTEVGGASELAVFNSKIVHAFPRNHSPGDHVMAFTDTPEPKGGLFTYLLHVQILRNNGASHSVCLALCLLPWQTFTETTCSVVLSFSAPEVAPRPLGRAWHPAPGGTDFDKYVFLHRR